MYQMEFKFPKKRNLTIPIKCKCGCGKITMPDQWGQYPAWIKEHRKHKSRNRFEWQFIYYNFLGTLPKCKCGCGFPTDPICRTLDQFINQGGYTGFYKYKKEHDPNLYHQNINLTNKDRSLIIGTLLGDSSIKYGHNKSKSPRITFNHGLKQKEWAEYKAAKLDKFEFKTYIDKNGGYGDFICSGTSKSISCLNEIYKMTHRDGKKIVTKEMLGLLDNEGIAWWFCDDGSSARRSNGKIDGCRFHTEGFSLEENEIIREYLSEKFGQAKICFYKKYHYIRMNHESSKKLINAIKEYIPESMQYKVKEHL